MLCRYHHCNQESRRIRQQSGSYSKERRVTQNIWDMPVISGPMQAHCIRLKPDDDLVTSLLDAARDAMAASNNSRSAFVLSAVGSVKMLTVRTASAPLLHDGGKAEAKKGGAAHDTLTFEENLEVTSLVGTFSCDGAKHLHVSVSDASGKSFGGHLLEGKVFSTLEIVLGTIAGVVFEREVDPKTGYRELVISAAPDCQP